MKKQIGYTLLEFLFVMMLIGLISIHVPDWLAMAAREPKELTTASHMNRVVKALNSYKQANSAAILANSSATVPATITVPMMVATGNLPAGFSATNAHGATVQGQYLQPQPGILTGVAIAVGGDDPGELNAGAIAAKLGSKGGRMTATGAVGTYNGWTLPITAFTNGFTNPGNNRLVVYLDMDTGSGSAAGCDDVSRHSVVGHPECTSMYTPLGMKSVVVENTNDALCPAGDATATGRIAVDSNGAVLSCQGKWKRQGSAYWLDPVASYGALSLITTDPIGTVRTTLDSHRSFMWDGTAWQATGIDQNGNLTLPGTMTAGKIQLVDVVVEGTPCPKNGLLAQDANGLTLSCQSGVWGKQSKALTSATINVSLSAGNFGAVTGNCPTITGDSNQVEYDYTVELTNTSLLVSSLSGKGFSNYGSAWSSVVGAIYVDGQFCAWDRGLLQPGDGATRVMAGAACTKTLFTGIHTISLCPTWLGIASELEFFGNISILN